MKEQILKVWNWLLISSENPAKYSLTIKSALVGISTVITMIAGLGNIQIGDLTPIIDTIISVVQNFFVFISSIGLAYGLIRKVYNTAKGKVVV